jgi:hypothetical protein
MTVKNGIIGLILVAVLGFGVWYLFTNSQSLPHVLNERGDRQIKEETEFYVIQAVYPNTTRLATRTDTSSSADKRAVRRIESVVEDAIDDFKRDAQQALTESEKARLTEAGLKYSFNLGYQPYNSGSFASFELGIFKDVGGAHPINSFKTLVFDLEGNEVKLGDLFVSGSDYLDRIATVARTQVEEQLASRAGAEATSTVIAAGLAPTAENFANWVNNDGTLMFFIPPSQAAAYAAGSFIVRISLDELRDILRPGVQ